jgi:hypothetical protein
MRRILNRLCLCAAMTPSIGACLADVAVGQPMLRWLFRPGDRFEIITAQDVTITAGAAQDTVRMSHRTVVQIGWEVSAVDSDGQAKILQQIERLKVRLKSPGMDELVYDTVSDTSPTGPVKQVADALQPLLKIRPTLTVDTRGRVREVQLNSENGKINAPAGRPFKQFLTGDGGLELSGLSQLVLPEGPVTANSSWKHTTQIQLAIGSFQRETTYQLTRSETRGGRSFPKVKFQWKLRPKTEADPALRGEAEPPPPVRIKSQKNEGAFLFDDVAHHPVQATMQQRMTLITRIATREVKQEISSATKTKIKRLSDGSRRP